MPVFVCVRSSSIPSGLSIFSFYDNLLSSVKDSGQKN